jgi:DNA-formamidopyrimidine glycosylase
VLVDLHRHGRAQIGAQGILVRELKVAAKGGTSKKAEVDAAVAALVALKAKLPVEATAAAPRAEGAAPNHKKLQKEARNDKSRAPVLAAAEEARALLDQGLISGIGNIYADESLWRARLHYDRATEALTVAKARELLGHVREVLAQALAEGGTSFDAQYVNVNGQAGYFEHSLNAYGRQGEGCARCGGTLRRESFMNRGSHFCPICQRMPSKRAAK